MSRLVRVGVVDSGINPRHPHVGSVAGGVGIRVRDGRVELDEDWQDLLGHGTAAAATIRGHAPEAALFSIRIFRRRLDAHVEALVRAIEWAADNGLDIVSSSLGCTSRQGQPELERVVRGSGLTIVSAASMRGEPSLLGTIPGVLAVAADPRLADDQIRHRDGIFYASPWARSLGELPKERNFHGTSLAVAHVSGAVAALLGVRPVTSTELGTEFRALCSSGGSSALEVSAQSAGSGASASRSNLR